MTDLIKWRAMLFRRPLGKRPQCPASSVAVATVLLLHLFSPAFSGPPLSLDDPGILDPLQMEVIVATTVTSTKTGDYYQLPLIDFSMGLLRDYVQATVVYPYASIRTDAGGSARAFGNPEAGIKWRFVNNERLQVAFAPVYGFGVADRVADKGIGDRSDSLIIPVNAEFKINDAWRLNGEVSYTFVDQGEDEWGYGAAAAYSVNERWEFLLELSGTSVNGFDADIFDVRAGFDTALTDSLHFLFSIATRTRELSREDQLDYDVFLGLQFIN